MFPELHRYPYFAYDTETTGLEWEKESRVFGFGISLPDGKDFYYDIREQPSAKAWLQNETKNYKGAIVAHNASYDYHVSRSSGIQLPLHCFDDTAIRACLINEHFFNYQLETVASNCIGAGKVDIVPKLKELFGGLGTKNVQFRNLPNAPVALVGEYCMGDSRLTLDLWEWQEREIKRQGLEKIVAFERQLMPLFIANEERGIRVNTARAEQASETVTVDINRMQGELDSLVNFECNVNSRNDIPRIFAPKYAAKEKMWYSKDGIELNTTPKGKPSFNAEALLRMIEAGSKEASLVVELRKMLKLRDTFLHGHVLGRVTNQGRIHPRIHQTKGEDGGTGTGRLSYSDPALQQIPSRDKRIGEAVRAIFEPEEGHSWVESDMASFEVRGFFHLAKSQPVIDEFQANPEFDMHAHVASETGLPRNRKPEGGPYAKQLNLAMMYVQGNGTTAMQMDLPWDWESFLPKGKPDRPENYITYRKAGPEAMAIIDRYHARIPGIKQFQKSCRDRARSRGHLFTCRGRHLRFPHGKGSHAAAAILSQATAAEWNKDNWLLIHEALRGTEGVLLLNTHDSYGLSLPIGQEEKLAKRVKAAIEDMDRSRIPLLLEVNKPGATWWDSYKKESEGWM